jgi:hypothetical protein
MRAICLITGVAGFVVSIGSLAGLIGVSAAITAVALLLVSVLLIVDKL